MNNFCVLTVCLTLSVFNVGANKQINLFSECTASNNKPGLCLALRNCTNLFNQLLKGSELTVEERKELSRSQCGYADNQPLVCCPEVSSTIAYNVLPQPGECGIIAADRTVRGQAANLYAFPWMAVLEYTKPNGKKEDNCVGVLISKQYILTAAHCVNGKDIPPTWNLSGARLGEYNLLTDPDCVNSYKGLLCADPVISVSISEKIVHELYDRESQNQANDIALLRMQSEIEYSDFVRPICLPQAFHLRSVSYEHMILDDAGWYRGTSEYSVKLAGTVHMIGNTKCKDIYENFEIYVQQTQLCGTSRLQPKAYQACRGLPGAPIMVEQENTSPVYWYVAGLQSFSSSDCAEQGFPNVYARISSFTDWIESNVRA